MSQVPNVPVLETLPERESCHKTFELLFGRGKPNNNVCATEKLSRRFVQVSFSQLVNFACPSH